MKGGKEGRRRKEGGRQEGRKEEGVISRLIMPFMAFWGEHL